MKTRNWLFPVLWITVVGANTAAAKERATSTPAADTLATAQEGGAETPQPKTATTPLSERIYYGGSVTFSVGRTTRIGIFPTIAYKFTPKLSGGIGLSYEYVDYEGSGGTAHNFGAGFFARYRILPQIYAHTEYRVSSYEIFTAPNQSHRTTVPFLLLGGGYSNRVGPRTWAYVEVLFDVLNDQNSPYEAGEPVLNVGFSVGF